MTNHIIYLKRTSLHGLFLRFLSFGLALFLSSGTLFAGVANLAWDSSTSPNVGGYKLSYGLSSGNYTSTIDVGNTTTYTVQGLTNGTKYYFAAKSYDSPRTTESAYSNEISTTIPIATALTADFKADTTSGPAPLAINFTPVTSGTITSWTWSFAGSFTPTVTTTTAKTVAVTYPNPGTYTVSLTVTGANGSVTKTKSNFITVTTATASPTANFSASPTSGVAPLSVNFTDASIGTITNRLWDFGDGSTSTAVSPAHTYSVAGTYTVSLKATSASGSDTKINSGFINVTSATSPPPANKTGLVAAYGFEEASGRTVADASGNGNNGTIKEAVRIAKGRYGKALKFDGINDWVTVKNSASLGLSTGMTLEAWVYQTSSLGNTIIMKEGTGFSPYEFYSSEDKDLPVSYFNDGNYQPIFGTNPVPLNTWTHLVSTYDRQFQRLYVNGVEVAKTARTSQILPSTGVLRIGGNSLWGEYFQGYIDEVRIYNRALTAQEVAGNLNMGISVSNPPKPVMGSKTLEPSIDYRQQGIAEAFQTIPTKSSVVTNVQVYLDTGSTATQLVAGIYTNKNDHPGTLVAQGKLSKLKSGAWNTVQIPVASVTAKQPYWIAILGLKGQLGFRNRIGSGTSLEETCATGKLTRLPRRWTAAPAKANADMSLYGKGY